MQISLLSDNTTCRVVEVESMEALSEHITKGFGWSPGTFKSNYRNLSNFQSMDVVALDFDEGMTIVEAELLLSGYQYVLATTRNHQKEKIVKGSGRIKPVCDRFRVIFRLSSPITSNDTYVATFNSLRDRFPAADPACSDSSRFFYPCVDVVSGSNDGLTIDPVTPAPVAPKQRRVLTEDERGRLARSTLEFIAIGVTSNRNRSAFKAAKDLQEQGYDEGEAEELLSQCPTLGEPGFELKDLLKAIKQAYKKEPKYEPRGLNEEDSNLRSMASESPQHPENNTSADSLESVDLLEQALAHLANPEAVKGTSTGWKEVDELLGGLRQGELGILQAYPKSGKTVLLTNLMCNLTAQGHGVGFASLEMHPAQQVEPDLYSLLLKKDIRQGVSDADKDKLRELLNRGRGFTYFKRVRRPTAEEICDWIRSCHRDKGLNFFFLDHFHKFVPDESSVASISRTITALTGLKYECPQIFVALIVQPTKEQRGREGLAERVGKNTLRGGASIFDECDWLINLHTKYATYRENETPWGMRRENVMASYPNDIRELEFEAIRAKPFSENMGKSLYMRYDKGTTEMKPHRWIAPEPERKYLPEQDDDRPRRSYSKREQSGWASDTWKNKRL